VSLADLLFSTQNYSLEEVAELFCVDKRTVRRWVASGKLASTHSVEGRLRFRRADIDAFCAWIEAGKH
jgi:excisionase family DNA binding protein